MEYSFNANLELNTLIIKLSGIMEDDDVHQSSKEVLEAAAQLQPGFYIINDISELRSISQIGSNHLKETQKMLFQLGAATTIRIVKNPVSALQFKRTAKEGGVGYKVLEMATVDEALDYIKNEVK